VIRHFTASGIVLSDDGHVLLVEHRKLGWWLYPGGHIDPDEDPVPHHVPSTGSRHPATRAPESV
jgi:8-oxo-dGTP pyrophosphatase MutT (NUDIX family)